MTLAMERVSKLIFSLKNYARKELSGGEKIKANLNESIETVLTLYHHRIKQGVEVIRNFSEVSLIECYPDEIIQVWTNLIHNAIQAMNDKGIIKINLYEDGSYINVEIIDNGSGIPLEIQENIFKPFYTTKPPGEGTGLGLDIVSRIVKKHKGEITVDSEVGNTKFTVRIPL